MAARQARFEELIESHSGIVFRVVHSYYLRPEDRLDLAQEIRLQLWSAFPKFDEAKSFSTWMYKIALNVAISWTRRAALRHRHSVPIDEIVDHASPASETHELQVVHQMIRSLDAMNQALLLLYLEDLSYAEIGEVLGISAGNVGAKINRLKQRLREEANEQE